VRREPAVAVVGVVWSIFQLATAGFWVIDITLLRPLHVMFTLTLIFLLHPFSKKGKDGRLVLPDILLALFSLSMGAYVVLNYEYISRRFMLIDPLTSLDILFGVLTIILVLEAARRTVGPTLSVLAVFFLAYSYFAWFMPGLFYFRGLSLEKIVEYQFLTTDGIFGIPVGVSSTYIYIFMLFAAFLNQTGVGKFFTDMAFALTGRSSGGPAKAAVVASSLFGTVSGSGSANVAATGTFTIPLMKSVGYKPHFAGAVEAVASTGGQIMPPVMGSAAFVMAQLTGISYWDICVAATIPAILYYVAVFMMVHLEAVKTGLTGLRGDQLPNLKRTLMRDSYLFLPLVAIVYFLSSGYSPIRAALMGIVATIAVSFVRKETRLTPRKIVNALIDAAKMATYVAAACACAGILLSVVVYTGLGLKLTSIFIMVSGGIIPVLLVLVAIACLILGMGMGTNAVYITVAALMVPTLIRVGIPLLPAHLFAFYFGCVSLFTPPVATATFVAAGIAGSEPMRTGVTAVKLGVAAFIVPFMFIFNQSLMMIGSPLEVASAFITAAVGCCAIAAAVEGYAIRETNILERVLLFFAAILLIHPGLITDLVGLGLLGVVLIRQLPALKSSRFLRIALKRVTG